MELRHVCLLRSRGNRTASCVALKEASPRLTRSDKSGKRGVWQCTHSRTNLSGKTDGMLLAYTENQATTTKKEGVEERSTVKLSWRKATVLGQLNLSAQMVGPGDFQLTKTEHDYPAKEQRNKLRSWKARTMQGGNRWRRPQHTPEQVRKQKQKRGEKNRQRISATEQINTLKQSRRVRAQRKQRRR